MKKTLSLLKFSIALAIFSSCAINKNYQAKSGLRYTGTYTVQSVNGKNVTFKEIPGINYTVDSDSLKVNDRIKINVVRSANDNTANRIVSVNNQLTKN